MKKGEIKERLEEVRNNIAIRTGCENLTMLELFNVLDSVCIQEEIAGLIQRRRECDKEGK